MAFATIDVTKGITGTIATSNLPTIPVTKGGTGLTSGTTDQILKFTGSTTIASAAQAVGGKVLQVVTEKYSTDTEISTTSYSNIFSKSITPTLNTSKVLVLISGGRWALYGSPSYEAFYSVRRDSSEIMHGLQVIRQVNGNIASGTISVSYLDSPSSSSSISYSLDAKTDNSARAVAACNAISPITMTLMEIGA